MVIEAEHIWQAARLIISLPLPQIFVNLLPRQGVTSRFKHFCFQNYQRNTQTICYQGRAKNVHDLKLFDTFCIHRSMICNQQLLYFAKYLQGVLHLEMKKEIVHLKGNIWEERRKFRSPVKLSMKSTHAFHCKTSPVNWTVLTFKLRHSTTMVL